MKKHKEAVQVLFECFKHNSPDVNADIARAAAKDAGNDESSADAIVEACFQVEFDNIGAARFLAMIMR